MAQSIPSVPGISGTQKDTHRGMEFMAANLNAWQAIASAMTRPESMASVLQGVGTLPETLLKMTQPVFSHINQMVQQFQKQTGKTGDYLESFDFTNMDKEALSIWKKLYDNEFRKLLKAPQLGLTREFQEKTNHFWDRFNILQSAMADFLHFLYLPFEKAHTSFQEKLAALAKENELPSDFKSFYQIWLKILEGHYMTLFQSPEYLGSLGKTLTAAAAYTKAKKALTNDLLQQFSIPSSTNIDGVYQELYDLKKRIKNLEKATTSVWTKT
jgi:tetratricopeptide (TPR) repeat protein